MPVNGNWGARKVSFDSEGGLSFDSIHPYRMCFCAMIVATRLVLAILLLYYGSLFLIYEHNLGDLLLNAVALEFVLSVDELMYEVLSPAPIKNLIASAHPLPVRSGLLYHKTWSGIDTKALITFALSLVWLIGIYLVSADPRVFIRILNHFVCSAPLHQNEGGTKSTD